MTEKEQRVWQYILANRKALPYEVAQECGVTEEFVQSLIDRIGTPEEVWRNVDNGAGEWNAIQETEDEDILAAAAAPAPSTRKTILTTAKTLTCGDRNKSYGQPHDNLSDCAALWEAYLNTKARCWVQRGNGYAMRITSEDVAWMMSLVKMARSFQPGMHMDNYIDATAYSAIAGECREILEAEGE